MNSKYFYKTIITALVLAGANPSSAIANDKPKGTITESIIKVDEAHNKVNSAKSDLADAKKSVSDGEDKFIRNSGTLQEIENATDMPNVPTGVDTPAQIVRNLMLIKAHSDNFKNLNAHDSKVDEALDKLGAAEDELDKAEQELEQRVKEYEPEKQVPAPVSKPARAPASVEPGGPGDHDLPRGGEPVTLGAEHSPFTPT